MKKKKKKRIRLIKAMRSKNLMERNQEDRYIQKMKRRRRRKRRSRKTRTMNKRIPPMMRRTRTRMKVIKTKFLKVHLKKIKMLKNYSHTSGAVKLPDTLHFVSMEESFAVNSPSKL